MTAGVLPPTAPAFYEMFETARYSIFRLETLPAYGGSGEGGGLAAFLAGDPRPTHQEMLEWMDLIRANARIGCVMRRVHVVEEPLSDYLRFELCWGYPYSVSAGEDVRILAVSEGEAWPEDVPHWDFWLYDSHRLIDMHYDRDGDWLGVEPVEAPSRIVAANRARDAALHQSVPWVTYIGDHPELAGLVPAEVMPRAL